MFKGHIFIFKKTSFNICFSSGFRAPNIDDFGKVFKKDLYVVVPNAELKPEQAFNTEIGFVQLFNTTNPLLFLFLKVRFMELTLIMPLFKNDTL